jgi:hypothetical protein
VSLQSNPLAGILPTLPDLDNPLFPAGLPFFMTIPPGYLHKLGSHGLRLSPLLLLYAMAAVFFLWPAYRASLNIVLDPNEGWNAYFADAAMGRMPLYPPPDKLITNNYPPLSFYVVGLAGRLSGDNILAGRTISLLALIAIAVAIAMMIASLGGDRSAAGVGGAYFIATMSSYFSGYVGMNDPQLLAQAIMAFACLSFLAAAERKSGYEAPVLAMVVAGFFKHNIITMPVAAFAWLAIHDRRNFVRCGLLAMGAVAAGFAGCCLVYGRNFLINFNSPRGFSISDGICSLQGLQWATAGFVVWCYAGWKMRADPRVQFCNLLVAAGLPVYFLQECGSGVDINAAFDLLIGLSVGVGLAFSLAEQLPLARRFKPAHMRIALLLSLCAVLAASKRLEPVLLLTDCSFRAAIADSEADMNNTVAQVRSISGDVYCDPMVTYRAEKPFAIDTFNVWERIGAGRLPVDTVYRKLNDGTLTYVNDPTDLVDR